MDPHKRSATIEAINDREQVLAQGRFGTDRDGYQTMLQLGRQYKDRIWAVEGCNGIGRHIAQRLVADGEIVVDVVPAGNVIRPAQDVAACRDRSWFGQGSSPTPIGDDYAMMQRRAPAPGIPRYHERVRVAAAAAA